MSYLRSLYKQHTSNTNSNITIDDSISKFIQSPTGINEELNELSNLLDNPSYEKVEVVFIVDILSQSLRQQNDFSKFISIITRHIENIMSYKNSIFILRIIRTIINTRFYVPLSYYITKVAELAISYNKMGRGDNKKFTYDNIRLSSDDLGTESLQLFVVSQCLALIRKHCSQFGNSISFPEFGFVVCNELRSRVKVAAFKELVGELIKEISGRKAYIEEKRQELKELNGKAVAEFESKLEKWEIK